MPSYLPESRFGCMSLVLVSGLLAWSCLGNSFCCIFVPLVLAGLLPFLLYVVANVYQGVVLDYFGHA